MNKLVIINCDMIRTDVKQFGYKGWNIDYDLEMIDKDMLETIEESKGLEIRKEL